MLRIFFTFLILLFSPLLRANDPVAKIQGMSIYADDFTRDTTLKIIELKGRVKIIFDSKMLTCDSAKIYYSHQKIQATGNVVLTDANMSINASEIYYDYENYTGVMQNAFVKSGQVMFEGSLIHKVSETEFVAENANYTTCMSCPASWEFSGKTIKAELGGYAHINQSFLKIGGIPFLWFPYLIVPLKSTRQSGLLPPEINYSSSGGLAIGESYFHVLSDSSDATFGLKNYEKRGLKALSNYRYRLSDISEGEVDAAWIKDRAFGNNAELNKYRTPDQRKTPIDRWFLKYAHYHELPEDYIQRADLNLSSDLQYTNDFSKETKILGDPAMENRISLTKNTADTHWTLDTSFYTNLLKENPKANNDDSVHRFPEIQYNLIKKPLWENSLYLDVDINSTHFARSTSSFDKIGPVTRNGKTNLEVIDNNGVYVPNTDIIRSGHRFDFNPQISKPFYLGSYLDVFPKISYRETHYQFNIENYEKVYRKYIRYELGVRSSASRVFKSDNSTTSYRHEIQPEIVANYVPWIDQGIHPFFGSDKNSIFFNKDTVTDNDILTKQKLQFDYKDRLYDKNIYTFALNNSLTSKRWIGDSSIYEQLVNIKISRDYDAQRYEDGGNPWSDIVTTLDLRYRPFELNATVNYFPEAEIANVTSRFRYTDQQNNFYQFEVLKKNFFKNVTELDSSIQTLDYTLATGLHFKYLNIVGKVVYDAITESPTKIKSWGYIAQFKPPGDCWLINLAHEQPTGADPTVDINFEFVFDGIQKTLLTPQDLEKIR